MGNQHDQSLLSSFHLLLLVKNQSGGYHLFSASSAYTMLCDCECMCRDINFGDKARLASTNIIVVRSTVKSAGAPITRMASDVAIALVCQESPLCIPDRKVIAHCLMIEADRR